MMFFKCCLILASLPWKNRFKKKKRIASHVYVFHFLVNFGWRFLCSRLAPCVLAGQQGENRTTLVFFLGGVTYAEIAALRFLSQMEDSGMEYIIATTKLMNGTTWIKSLMDRPESQNQWDTCVYTWLHQTTHPLWLKKKKKLIYSSYVHQWTAGVLLMSVLLDKAKDTFFFVYCQRYSLNTFWEPTSV